jgi:hypothetical protein
MTMMTQNPSTATRRFCLGLSLAVVLMIIAPALGWAAGEGVGDVGEALEGQTLASFGLMHGVAIVLGIGFTIAGLIKLKDWAEDSSRNPLQSALVRLAVGACLVALPWIINISKESLGTPTEGGGYGGKLVESNKKGVEVFK